MQFAVMRLARPKLYDTVCIPIDPGDPMSELIGSAVCRLTGQKAADEPVGEYLMAPQIFEYGRFLSWHLF